MIQKLSFAFFLFSHFWAFRFLTQYKFCVGRTRDKTLTSLLIFFCFYYGSFGYGFGFWMILVFIYFSFIINLVFCSGFQVVFTRIIFISAISFVLVTSRYKLKIVLYFKFGYGFQKNVKFSSILVTVSFLKSSFCSFKAPSFLRFLHNFPIFSNRLWFESKVKNFIRGFFQ